MQILFDTSGWNDWCKSNSSSVRFIKDTEVHEEFLCFVPVSSTTGKDLASTILIQLSQLGLNLEHMRGQGYDGASNMSGKYHGVQANVKELYPLAMYTHCCNHVLNLAISTSSQLPVIRNAMTTLSDIRPLARRQDLVGHNTFLGGQDFCFCYMFKTNFWAQNLGGTAPECPLVATGLGHMRFSVPFCTARIGISRQCWKRSFRLGFFATEAETNLRHTLGGKAWLDHHFSDTIASSCFYLWGIAAIQASGGCDQNSNFAQFCTEIHVFNRGFSYATHFWYNPACFKTAAK